MRRQRQHRVYAWFGSIQTSRRASHAFHIGDDEGVRYMGRPSGHYWVEGYKDYTPDPRPVPAHGVKKKPLRRIRLLDDLPSLDCRAVCERLGIPRVRFIRLRRHPIFPSPVGTDRWGYELWSKRAVDRFAERIAQADEDDPLGYAPPSDDDDDN